MKLVIDTSLLIDELRNGTNWELFNKSVDKESELFLPSVVIFELFSGMSTRNPIVVKKINAIIRHFIRVDLNDSIAQRAGEIYRDVNAHFSPADYLIAATALELGAQVVTLNLKHFRKIPGLQIYEME